MLSELMELFGVDEPRAQELFLLFLDSDGERADKILTNIMESSITTGEKLFVTYIIGFMSSIKMAEPESPAFFKTKTYVH